MRHMNESSLSRGRAASPRANRLTAPLDSAGEGTQSDPWREWESEVARSSREYVAWVQSALNRIAGARLVVDGISGPNTRSAVRAFQQRRGLDDDGIVGPLTEAALLAAGAPAPPVATGGTGATAPSSTGSGRVGDIDPHPEAFLAVTPPEVEGRRLSADWVERALYGVIARRGHSKRWDHVLPLDGGTVGIANFARGGLRRLYAQMDTQRYFGAFADQIPDRPYSNSWWREGMTRFVQSPGTYVAQIRAWLGLVQSELLEASRHGWSSDRELAIAAGITNSSSSLFYSVARESSWDAERALDAYVRRKPGRHREGRRDAINREFPSSR